MAPVPRRSPSRVLATACALVLACALAPVAFGHPGSGIAVDAEGRVLLANGPRSRLLRLEKDGTFTTLVEGGLEEPFRVPHHLVRAPDGTLYTASDSGRAVWRVSPAGELARVHPRTGVTPQALVGAGGYPFIVDADGSIVTADSEWPKHGRLIRVLPDGAARPFAGGAAERADGRGEVAGFGGLHGGTFAFGPGRRLYLTDAGTAIRIVSAEGAVTTLAGGDARGFADGAARAARFDGAAGLHVDAEGVVLVADARNHRIRRVAPDGTVTTIAGTGAVGERDGPALEATFREPVGVTRAADGTLWILDYDGPGRRILVRRLAPDGTVTTAGIVDDAG